MSDVHDAESTPDAGELPELDLSPRTGPDDGSGPSAGDHKGRSAVIGIVFVVLLIAGFLAVKALGNATLYFYQANEAVDRRSELGDRRFRMLGNVDSGPVERTGDGVEFTVTYDGVTVPVRHVGDPPQLFKAGVPVVLEGSWAPDRTTFASDRILVKHTEDYVEKNPDRKTAADIQP